VPTVAIFVTSNTGKKRWDAREFCVAFLVDKPFGTVRLELEKCTNVLVFRRSEQLRCRPNQEHEPAVSVLRVSHSSE
jgi:hypothetical protein